MAWERHADTVTFDDVTVIHETAQALKVLVEGSEEWIPKSQIHENSEVYKTGTDGKLVITRWLAEQRGLV